MERLVRRGPEERNPRTHGKCCGALAAIALFTMASTPAVAQERSLLWGDTHVHTSYSPDAYRWGTVVDPDDAYRFARGLPIVGNHGTRVRLDRPLDFLVLTDHSGGGFGAGAPVGAERGTPEHLEASWSLYVDAAERHNDSGRFTTMVGWEWTAMPPGGRGTNLHRIVFTPTDGETAKRFLPISPRDGGPRPEALWQWLEETSERLGIDFVAIPHNSNISEGLMFDQVDSDGRSISAEYARTRMRWEPVVELFQIKGNSETHPMLSPEDEFADFEIYTILLGTGEPAPEVLPGSYARTGLLRGLDIEERVGINPFKFGFQGATDTHTGLADVSEENFTGKNPIDTPPAGGLLATPSPMGRDEPWNMVGWDYAAVGITGVWATENTRDAITAAFQRKEVYATSGPRIQLQVFGGFGFSAADADARDFESTGYQGGVPMGGDLARAPNGASPTLLIRAVKDPGGANLDRVQVVKGWLEGAGLTHERVYDVAWAGNRVAGGDGRLPQIESTVNLERLTYDNSVGNAELSVAWTDPDFDPSERAFYYARVLEIPTPRHSTYDAGALGLDLENAWNGPATIQERAMSSPIWYTP